MEEKVPAYYVVSRFLDEDQVARAQQVLSLTPVSHVIITDIHDADIAMKFSQVVLKAATPERAAELAREYKEPSVIIGGTVFMDAYYADGTEAPLSC